MFIVRILKKSIVTVISAIITVVIVFGSYTIFAQEPKYTFEKFDRTAQNPPFLNAQFWYHKEMNDMFNGKLEVAAKILGEPGGADSANLRPPRCSVDELTNNTCKDKCGNSNFSPYCVSMEALDMYTRYLTVLDAIKNNFSVNSIWGASYSRLLLVADIATFAGERDKQIDKDIEDSRKIMEATLAAYNEFLTAYPIHSKYEEIITNLIKYKKKLKDIRRQVTQFPGEFVDATSTKCE